MIELMRLSRALEGATDRDISAAMHALGRADGVLAALQSSTPAAQDAAQGREVVFPKSCRCFTPEAKRLCLDKHACAVYEPQNATPGSTAAFSEFELEAIDHLSAHVNYAPGGMVQITKAHACALGNLLRRLSRREG